MRLATAAAWEEEGAQVEAMVVVMVEALPAVDTLVEEMVEAEAAVAVMEAEGETVGASKSARPVAPSIYRGANSDSRSLSQGSAHCLCRSR